MWLESVLMKTNLFQALGTWMGRLVEVGPVFLRLGPALESKSFSRPGAPLTPSREWPEAVFLGCESSA